MNKRALVWPHGHRVAVVCSVLLETWSDGKSPSSFPRTTPLPAALGASVEARLPQGKHASQWRRLLTEVQMRWHASQANQAREARGD